jgi:hypothetical protein
MRVLIEDRDAYGGGVGQAEPDVVGGRRLAGEKAGRGADLDLVAGRAELVARLPRGGLRAGKEFLRGMDAIAAATRDGEGRQKGENPQLNSLLSGDGGDMPGCFCRKLVREFPAHPRDSQVKTPQEETRWKD